MQVVSTDAHLRYTVAVVEDAHGKNRRRERTDHAPGAILWFASRFEPGTPIDVEALGSWHWIVDEIEEAGMVPKLVNAGKAKALLGSRNKTDHLDAKVPNVHQRTGTLPTVWIPSASLRDQRELYGARMFIERQCTRLKNRILATLAKYALSGIDATDRFGEKGREQMERRIAKLPSNAQYVVDAILTEVDQHEHCVQELDDQMEAAHCSDPRVDLLDSLPGAGRILAVVIRNEVRDRNRFPSSRCLAAYAGLTPRVHSSGGKTRHLSPSPASNMYLKWAFTEAANLVCLNQSRWPSRHVTQMHKRIRGRRGHGQAIGAVARHLAEAAYCMLKRGEESREPQSVRPWTGKRVPVMSRPNGQSSST